MKNKNVKKIIGTTITAILAVILIVLFIAVGAVIVQLVQGKTPALLGYRIYYVLTDSMLPTYEPGDVVLGKVVTEEDADLFTVGQVVTYTAEFGEKAGEPVTHRIVTGVHYNEEIKDFAVITKGDKAGASLDKPVRLSRINAVIVGRLSFLTWLYSVFRNGSGIFLLLMIPMIAMLVVLVVRLVITIKEKNNENDGKTENDSEKNKEERIKELRKQAIEEYLQQQESEEKK